MAKKKMSKTEVSKIMKDLKIDVVPRITHRAIIDAKKNRLISVSEEQSEKGRRKTCYNCPVSQSVVEKYPDVLAALIYRSVAYLLEKNGHWVRYGVEGKLGFEIKAHDRGGKFAPGDYVLNIPNKHEIRRRGKAHSARPPNHKRPYRTKRITPLIAGIRDCPRLSHLSV